MELKFLGGLTIQQDGEPLTELKSKKGQGLVCYLAMNRKPVSRPYLAALFWPDVPDSNAFSNLRKTLQRLKPLAPYLLIERETISINHEADYWLDVTEFERGAPSTLLNPESQIDITSLQKAVNLYQGDFLDGFMLPDTPMFEEWVLAQRARLREKALASLHHLVSHFRERQDYGQALKYARQRLTLEPWHEETHRALMELLARSGKRSEALVQYESCRQILADELDVEPAAATVELFKRIKAGVFDGALQTPKASGELPERTDIPAHNLPTQPTPFIGRSDELEALDNLIADPAVRLVTIVGPGGMGKTRLALEAARNQLSQPEFFPDGVFFVSLAPLETAEEIDTTLASVIGLDFEPTGRSAGSEREQILEHLARKKILLVMDNFEHVLVGRKLLTEISKKATGVKLLATSRERLQLHGEQIFPIRGLEMPQPDKSAHEAPADYAAAQLFLNIARRSNPNFELLPGDAEQVLRICRLVEGMPLGLELAATWTGLLSLPDIADEIEQSMALLNTGHDDMPDRHRSMQATLDLSWKRLTDEQRRAFKQLCIFRGGFTRKAAVAVAGANLPLLAALVNKSWLTYDRKSDRYYLHELLRQYGNHKLKRNTVFERQVWDRHSDFFCDFLKAREMDWFRARQVAAAAEVQNEIENIQSAWRWAAGRGDVHLLTQGYNSLGRFYSRQMRRKAGREAFRLAADGLSTLPTQQERDDLQRLTLWSQILAWQAYFTNEFDQKQTLLSQSQDILDRVKIKGQDVSAPQAFIFLQQAKATGKRDYEAAIRFSNLALELFRALGDRVGEAEALKELGLGYRRLGQNQDAINALRTNLEIRQQLDDSFGVADAMNWLGLALMHRQKNQEAEQLFRQALGLFRQLESRYYEVETLGNLSYIQMWAGEYLVARELLDQALGLERDYGLSTNLWIHLNSIGCNGHLGYYEMEEAKAEVSLVLDMAEQRGLTELTASVKGMLASGAMIQGDLELAKDYLQESLVVFRKADDILQYDAICWLGYIARTQGDGSTARKHLKDVLRAVIEYDFTELFKSWWALAALLAVDDGQLERAFELYGLAHHIGFIKNSQWWQDFACRELEDVRACLPPGVAAAAEGRGRELDISDMAEALLAELSAHSASSNQF